MKSYENRIHFLSIPLKLETEGNEEMIIEDNQYMLIHL